MAEQINSFWELAREQSVEGTILRRRAAAIGAGTLGFCGLLLAIGLGVLVLVFVAGILVSVGAAVICISWPRLQALGGDRLAYVRDRSGVTCRRLLVILRSARKAARAAFIEARAHSNALGRAAAASVSDAGKIARAATARYTRTRLDPTREAIRLNATGTQERRAGGYRQAVDCHREALEILRSLGDRRGVALTQSNLALALSHSGDDVWAVGLFEEAAATLRALGDEEHEAQIIANLGVTHRRHGRPEEGEKVLALALSKLNPASSAYQTIEAELRRAS